ncbi:hypothetical protein [Streptomyces yaizuensis]|uniref:Glycosyltransferase family 39 protein n=1 Tax=Streptomyces yaizuensis TaxID=2989713 RepID=A0ABQ5NVT0_9ACTN|nr:hypothetical protein [Streptomyces sp. YSPA8]GLF94268.1 glycosyltransferase family 39 protein [Streptomyces sp. YSPA8]
MPATTSRTHPFVPASRRPRGHPRGPGRGNTGRLPRALRRAAPALAAYVAVRLCGLLVVARLAHAQGHGVWPVLAASWDSRWYLDIAAHGYADELGTRVNANNLAFFPLYPLLVRALAAVVPGAPATVALVFAVGCSLVAAWGVFAVGDRLYGRRTGTVLVVLWGALPVAQVQWMGYTESLFTAVAAWSLYAVVSGRWIAAGALACLAGLARPTGVAVAAAVCLAALVACRRGPYGRKAAAAVLAPLGWLGYVAWVGLRVGRPDGYFAVQRLWKNEWDGGRATLLELRQQLLYASRPPLFLLLVSAVLIVSSVLYVLSLADRQPLPLLVFSGVLLLVVLGSAGVYFPRARFLLPAFPLLLPAARALAGARPVTVAVVLVSATALSAWSGAYMLLVWEGPP